MSVKVSLLDRFLREVAPGRAVDRLLGKRDFEMVAAGAYEGAYKGALDSRMRTWHAHGRSTAGTEDKAVGAVNRSKLRLECRDVWRNTSIARGIVDRYVDYAIWKGIRPQARTSNPKWNEIAETWWEQVYVPTADYRQLPGVDLITLQGDVVANDFLDGDCGFILLANGQVLPVESERICTPEKIKKDDNVTEGVVMTKQGILRGFFVCARKNSKGSVDKTKFKFVKRENFIYCYNPKRFDQLRGIPRLAPALPKLRDYDETDEAVMGKVKLDAMQQFKRYIKGGPSNRRGRDYYTKVDSDSKNPQRVQKTEWGQVHELVAGEEMDAFESKTPSREYVPYLKHELQDIGACMNIPYEFMMLIFTDGSFSAQRMASIHVKHAFTQTHDWVIRVFLRRLWNWRIAKAMKHGELPEAPKDKNGVSEWWRVEWSLPFFDWVDPDKQAKAETSRVKLGSTSVSSITKSQGRDLSDIRKERDVEIKDAIERANLIKKETGEEDISWRDYSDAGRAPAAPAPAGGGEG